MAKKKRLVIYWQNAYSAIVTIKKRYASLNLFNDVRCCFHEDVINIIIDGVIAAKAAIEHA